jgi:uncharacterized membrane protein
MNACAPRGLCALRQLVRGRCCGACFRESRRRSAVNELLLSWRDRACTSLASAIVVGFIAFFVFSVMRGISKESVYTGPVGFWLGAYLLFATIATAACIALLLWMFQKREPRWRRQAVLLLCAWLTALLSYWAWHLYAQTQYT